MKRFCILSLICACAFGQSPVVVAPGPATESVYNYDGSNRLTSICTALSVVTSGLRASIRVSITSATQANPTVLTATGHGFAVSARPSITISGVTGTGYSGINKQWTATVVDANTFSITFDSSLLAAPTLTNAVFTTTAPRAGVAEWSIQKYTYDGSSNLIWSGFILGSSTYNQNCSDASSTSIQQQ